MSFAALMLTCYFGEISARELLDPPPAPPLEAAVPMDFKPDLTVELADVRAKELIGLSSVVAKKLKGYKGIQPWWVYKFKGDVLPAEALLKGDVLLAINGKAVQANVQEQFRLAHADKAKCFWITRWRPNEQLVGGRNAPKPSGEGKIERFFIDLGQKMYDLKKTRMAATTRDWRLGPLGASGWCFHVTTIEGATRDARQMVITAIDEDGPSFGKLQERDVIIGVNGKDFDWDVRKALAKAILEAEKEENKGRLNLKVWRVDKAINVQIDLPVLGEFAKTAPYDCPKTDKIIDNAVEYIKANSDRLLKFSADDEEIGWINYLTGLGLMATGRKDIIPYVKKLAHETILPEGQKLNIDRHVGMMCWRWSYRTLFLCEYYLYTQDEAVLPTIEEYATKLAMGQSGAGTWGHTYAALENAGKLHGPLGGYGAINQQGITIMLALPLAVKCGIKNNEVLDAVKRGENFFGYFINKGTIPYGDHGPSAHAYDDQGKSGAAAILFDFLDRQDGKSFFSEMVLGSAPSGKEEGHTGHFWSLLWGGIGTARSGPNALQAYMKEMSYVFTLERQPTGRYVFQHNPGEGGPKKDPKWHYDSTGSRLLQLCYPRRAIYLTGKGGKDESLLSDSRIKEIFEVGRLYHNKEARSKVGETEILKLLKAKLPPTRTIGVKILTERNLNIVDKLIEMLKSDDKYAQYGAAEALRENGYGSEEAANQLIKLIQKSTDLTFLTYAIKAFTHWDANRGLIGVSKPAIPVLLEMVLKDMPNDPRGVLRNILSENLFYGGRSASRGIIHAHGIEGEGREFLVPALKILLTNENGRPRQLAALWAYPNLTDEEREEAWGDIYRAVTVRAPSGVMFSGRDHMQGLKLMAAHNVKEGLDLAIWYYQYGKMAWGSADEILKLIEGYGGHAKESIPKMVKAQENMRVREKKKELLTRDYHPINKMQRLIDKLKMLPDEPKKTLASIADKLDALGVVHPPKPIVIPKL